MGDQSRNLEIAISWGDELINVLNDTKGIDVLVQISEHLRAIQYSCDQDSSEVEESRKDLQKKLDACKEKTSEANSEIENEEEMERIQKELDEEIEMECKLKDELRYTLMADEVNDLNSEGDLIKEQRLAIKRNARDQLRTERKLSMYASVTNVIPNIDDPFKTTGYMVDRNKGVIEKFEFDTDKRTSFETCNSIWGIINKQ